jgi:hypothetical protein
MGSQVKLLGRPWSKPYVRQNYRSTKHVASQTNVAENIQTKTAQNVWLREMQSTKNISQQSHIYLKKGNK